MNQKNLCLIADKLMQQTLIEKFTANENEDESESDLNDDIDLDI